MHKDVSMNQSVMQEVSPLGLLQEPLECLQFQKAFKSSLKSVEVFQRMLRDFCDSRYTQNLKYRI